MAKFTQDTIYDASKGEIVKFAASDAGLEFTGEESREFMIVQLCEALDWIEKDPRTNATHVIVKINKTAEPGGEHPVRGGLNGRMFTIERETEVTIPIGYYNVLMDANNSGFTVRPMTQTKPNAPSEERVAVSRYPVQVIRFINKG